MFDDELVKLEVAGCREEPARRFGILFSFADDEDFPPDLAVVDCRVEPAAEENLGTLSALRVDLLSSTSVG